jgi:hypothetical protein
LCYLKSSNPKVGVIYPDTVFIEPNSSLKSIPFYPLSPGDTTLSFTAGEKDKRQEIKAHVTP